MSSTRSPSVLIPSSFENWVNNFIYGYGKLGWKTEAGADKFQNVSDAYDVLHLNWPEELVGWREPDEAALEQTQKLLEDWRQRARIVLTVNNLYPHGAERSEPYRRLYDAFYTAADVIHHQSRESHQQVCRRHPGIAHKEHVVTSGFNYDPMVNGEPINRTEARIALGIDLNAKVFLYFGAIRFADELRLVRRAFQKAKVPNSVFLSAVNFAPKAKEVVRWRYEVHQWRRWLNQMQFPSFEGFIPDEKVIELVRASDAMIIARADSLTSGLPCLALTLGRLAIAPNQGSVAEYLKGTDNPLYEPKNIQSLASAMRSLSEIDQRKAEKVNRDRADTWTWDNIIAKCLDGLKRTGSLS